MTRPAGEWEAVLAKVAPFADPDPGSNLHRVGLEVTAGRLRWVATDSYRMAILDGGPVDLPDLDIRLSPIQVAFAASQAASGVPIRIDIDDEFPDVPVVRANGTVCRMTVDRDDWPDIDAVVAGTTGGPSAHVGVSAVTLRNALSAISQSAGDGDVLHFGVRLEDGRLLIAGTDAGTGVFQFELECRTDVREVAVAVGLRPELLASLVAAVRAHDIDLEIPLQSGRALTLVDGHWAGYLMPMRPAVEVARAQLETALEEAFDSDLVELNADGSYAIDGTGRGADLRVALRDGDEPAVLVSTVLLSDVAESLALLREVNEFNRGAQCCRAYVDDGRVIVESELSLLTLDGDELVAAAERLAGLVGRLTPLMTMYFAGGQ